MSEVPAEYYRHPDEVRQAHAAEYRSHAEYVAVSAPVLVNHPDPTRAWQQLCAAAHVWWLAQSAETREHLAGFRMEFSLDGRTTFTLTYRPDSQGDTQGGWQVAEDLNAHLRHVIAAQQVANETPVPVPVLESADATTAD